MLEDIITKQRLRGTEALSDEELLALLFEDEVTAATLIKECGSLSGIATTTPKRLRMLAGLGTKRTEQLLTAMEIGRRIAQANADAPHSISSSNDIVEYMRPLLKGLKHEECWAVYLTTSNRIIERYRISQGGIQATVVDQRIVVKRALELLSTRLILVHNHPSGNATPSDTDFKLTRHIKEATKLFDIELLDHIIISTDSSYSFKSNGNL